MGLDSAIPRDAAFLLAKTPRGRHSGRRFLALGTAYEFATLRQNEQQRQRQRQNQLRALPMMTLMPQISPQRTRIGKKKGTNSVRPSEFLILLAWGEPLGETKRFRHTYREGV